MDKRGLFLRLDKGVVKQVDLYAAEHDLYRNAAVERLILIALAASTPAEARRETV
jgi:hypothetical protein